MAELNEFVGATPEEPAILNKLGLIIKVRQGISKARMILDTKESGVKRITGKFQRVTLPRLLEGVLQMLLMLSFVTTAAADATAAFVLDFTEAFWQMPIHPSERKYYCATPYSAGADGSSYSYARPRVVQLPLFFGPDWRHSLCD
jgi:hypothetical protein